ncbi:MAG: hypothetical protein ACJAWT_000179 [Glaciecola sp.]|jgi:hypothetical protein
MASLHRFVIIVPAITVVVQAIIPELLVRLQDDNESLSNRFLLASEALAATRKTANSYAIH